MRLLMLEVLLPIAGTARRKKTLIRCLILPSLLLQQIYIDPARQRRQAEDAADLRSNTPPRPKSKPR